MSSPGEISVGTSEPLNMGVNDIKFECLDNDGIPSHMSQKMTKPGSVCPPSFRLILSF